MAEKGMVFCDWKVRYIAGMKPGELGQTRRVIKPQPPDWVYKFTSSADNEALLHGEWMGWEAPKSLSRHIVKARYQPGDRVYAKEALLNDLGWAHYRADKRPVELCPDTITPWKWGRDVLPTQSMPKWAARYWLTILDVRVEQLQEITYPDVVAEGIDFVYVEDWQTAFAAAWDSIHGKGAWDRNPWVWVYTFRKEES